jgi:hypothetical protein
MSVPSLIITTCFPINSSAINYLKTLYKRSAVMELLSMLAMLALLCKTLWFILFDTNNHYFGSRFDGYLK